MKRLTLYVAIVSLLPCLGLGEQQRGLMASCLRQVRLGQRSLKGHATICLEEMVAELRGHKQIRPHSKMGCVGTKTESGNVPGWAQQKIPLASFLMPAGQKLRSTESSAPPDYYYNFE
jgi:hypothetical protein